MTSPPRLPNGGGSVIEEVLMGEEFGAQVIVVEGRVAKCLCHNDTVTPRPVTVPIGHSCPSRLSDNLRKQAARVCQAAIDALGIQNAVCNADLIATSDGIRVLEIGARIGATGIPEVIRLCHGIDLYEIVLRMAMGETPKLGITEGPASAVLIVRAPGDGKLVRCRIPRDLDEPEPWQVGHASSAPCSRIAPRTTSALPWKRESRIFTSIIRRATGSESSARDPIGLATWRWFPLRLRGPRGLRSELSARSISASNRLWDDDGESQPARCLDPDKLEGGDGF